jgi:hypothetical protein
MDFNCWLKIGEIAEMVNFGTHFYPAVELSIEVAVCTEWSKCDIFNMTTAKRIGAHRTEEINC